MDIIRPELKTRRKRRRIAWASVAVVALVALTLFILNLEPALPASPRAGTVRGRRSTLGQGYGPEPKRTVSTNGKVRPQGWMRSSLRQRVWIALVKGVLLAPGLAALIGMAWQRFDLPWHWLLGGSLLGLTIVIMLEARLARWALKPLAGASTVIAALRDGDYSLRLRETRLLGVDDLAHSINLLADSLRSDARSKRESGLLLDKIPDEIELAVLAFRDDGELTLTNPAARRLIGLKLHQGLDAEAPGLRFLLEHGLGASVRLVLPGGSGSGLALVRRIAELHGGGLELLALDPSDQGCRARLWLGAAPAERQSAPTGAED